MTPLWLAASHSWSVTVGAAAVVSSHVLSKREPSLEPAKRISKTKQVTLGWLGLGVGPMRRNPEADRIAAEVLLLPAPARQAISAAVSQLLSQRQIGSEGESSGGE